MNCSGASCAFSNIYKFTVLVTIFTGDIDLAITMFDVQSVSLFVFYIAMFDVQSASLFVFYIAMFDVQSTSLFVFCIAMFDVQSSTPRVVGFRI
jgi:hypothetical protein